jgi:multicomponent K+:H+ antiporter subunit C
MALVFSLGVGVVAACGVYLLLRKRTYTIVLGLALLSYATNLFLFASGRLSVGKAPIFQEGNTDYADPIPQALVLTAIVIGLAMTAFVVVLAMVSNRELGSDHVDAGREDDA